MPDQSTPLAAINGIAFGGGLLFDAVRLGASFAVLLEFGGVH